MLTKDDLTKRLKVQKKTLETPDTASFDLEIPPELQERFRYKGGQFVTLFMDINGEDVRRSYSLASSPECDSMFRLAIKRVEGGVGSNYLLDQVQEGAYLHVTPPAGHFCLPENLDNLALCFYAAGSGITPVISLIKSALHKSATCKCHLLYANRNENSIIFHRDLKSLADQFPGRLMIDYALSAPLKPWDGFQGRVHGTFVKEFILNHGVSIRSIHYTCGPEGFMSTVESAIEVLGFNREQIKKESFAVSTSELTDPSQKNTAASATGYLAEVGTDVVLIGDKEAAEKPQQVEVTLGGEHITVTAVEGKAILETLLEEGYNPPYSCMDGACMACLGKIEDGLVYQEDMGILTPDNTEVGECLTCQAKPASKIVKVSYDL